MTAHIYDRSSADVGNIIALEHVNVVVPDVAVAMTFYVHALGFTRDPYVDLGPDLTWINVGRQQFHLPTGEPQVVRGVIELVVPDLRSLRARLQTVAEHLAGTSFDVQVRDDVVDVRGPWGNRFRLRESSPVDHMTLGLSAVEYDVPEGSPPGIGRFYEQIIGAPVSVHDGCCTVGAGPGQVLRFRETSGQIEPYEGEHVAIYVANFSNPHTWLVERDLIVEETDQHQYRFNWIVDPGSGQRLFEVEHEVRSLHHRLYQRPLINRNPDQNLRNYVPGADPFHPRGVGTTSPDGAT